MSLISNFDHWKSLNGQHGRQAFSRFIMLTFLEGLQDTSEDFIFKGGNHLWHYIRTPRETIDLDLATLNIKSHLEVKDFIEKSFKQHHEISFSIDSFQELDGVHEVGAGITISFSTSSGQRNKFSIDIVYALPTDIVKIKSTIDGEVRRAASIENIICDKLSASQRFKSGNTRMKDFDDLWRIMESGITIDTKKLSKLLGEREIKAHLEMEWVGYLENSWKQHVKSYKDIPSSLEDVFVGLNKWLNRL